MALALSARLLREAGFRHGFSLRTGGVSAGPFRGLNLARNVGDDPNSVEENHRLLASWVGYEAPSLYEVSQIHGAQIAHVDGAQTAIEFRHREADALVTCRPGTAIGIRVADCVPILVACPRSSAVLAIHAGWKGIVAGVVGAALSELGRVSGARASDLLCAIGPHIGPEAFEVGAEVAAALAECIPEATVVIPREPRPHVDLGRAVQAQLRRAGVAQEHIEIVGGCTFADATRFYSFRRDGTESGRHLAAIVARC